MTVYVDCPRCDGEGQVKAPSVFASVAGGPDYPVCRQCHGTGNIEDKMLSQPEQFMPPEEPDWMAEEDPA